MAREEEPVEILLIEENLSQADLIQEMLSEARGLEFSVRQVRRLAEGLTLLKNQRFDLVMVDLELPDSRGLETALSVLRQSLRTPVIALTTLDDEEVALELLQMDIEDYLVKGEFTGPLLVRAIRYAIQRKRGITSLRESAAKFSQIFQAAPALISINAMDDGRYLEVNEEFIRTLEFGRDEVFGHNSLDLGILERSDRETLLRIVQENGKVRNFETSLRSKRGSIIIGLLSTEIIEMDGEKCLLTFTRDITELRAAEEERTRLALIVESSEDAIIGKTLEGIITSWNKGAEKIYGYSAEEVSGKHISILAPADYPDEIPRILDQVRKGEVIKRLETTRVRKDGRLIPVALTISPIIDANKRLLGASTIARDISERKRAEEEIERLNVKLAARATELESVNQDLEAFNYTVAHDLRQPLNVVNGYCQAIEMLCGDQLQKECRDYVHGAYNGTLRMNQLIEALLNFSRLAHAEPRQETVDLSAMAHQVAEELRLAEPGRQVDFRIADGIVGTGDAGLLRIVLDNLLGNAWKYADMREQTVIEFDVRQIDGNPVYFIRDNGPGFDMTDAAKLFAPFHRLPGAKERKGFGIGLATVDRIIGQHGGKVWAEGVPDQGATFFFTLSAAEVST